MYNPTRTLLILSGLAIGGVLALGYGAQRYARIVETRAIPVHSVQLEVDRFIEVRRGMRREIDSWRDENPQHEALSRARDRALLLHRFDPRSYAEMRRLYRVWRAGRLRAGTPTATALERRRQQLQEIDLGGYESLDS